MSTFVSVNTYAYSVTYVTDKILHSLQTIIRLSGLSPEKLVTNWVVLERGITRWLATEDLVKVILEVYHPVTDKLIGRWDIEIHYGYTGDGTFWVDTDDIAYHIKKAGIWPNVCAYQVIAMTKPGQPSVEGWSDTTLRSTDGFIRQSIGTTIDGSGLSGGTVYWRKVS